MEPTTGAWTGTKDGVPIWFPAFCGDQGALERECFLAGDYGFVLIG